MPYLSWALCALVGVLINRAFVTRWGPCWQSLVVSIAVALPLSFMIGMARGALS